MKYKLFIILLITFGISINSKAFDGSISLNCPALLLTNISLKGEYAINEKMTINLGISYKAPFKILTSSSSSDSSIFLNIQRFTITPEIRFYPKGFLNNSIFYGIYLRYNILLTQYYTKGLDYLSGLTIDEYYMQKIYGPSIGLLAGYKINFKNYFIEAFGGIGLAYNTYYEKLYFMSKYAEYTEVFDPKENINYPLLFKGTQTVKDNNMITKFPFIIPALRFGINIGFYY